MKLLPPKMISDKSLLCALLCLLWVVADTNAESTAASLTTQEAEPTTTLMTTQPTTILTTIPPPDNVKEVRVVNQTKDYITVSWDKIENIPSYFLKYEQSGIQKEEYINKDDGRPNIVFMVESLTPGTKYNFIVITTLNGRNSTGTPKQAVTRPLNAENLTAIEQDETSITLQWNTVGNSKFVLRYESREENINASETVVTKKISNLNNTKGYDFELFTVFEDVESSGKYLTAFTAPPNPKGLQEIGQNTTSITLQWKKVGDLLEYILTYDEDEVNVPANVGQGLVTKTINNLNASTEYNFIVFAVFNDVRSSGLSDSAVTAPDYPKDFRPVGQDNTSITLQWKKVGDLLEYILTYGEDEVNVPANVGQGLVTQTIDNLNASTEYSFTVFAVFKTVRSTGVSKTAVTAPRDSEDFRAVGQDETSITLQWTKMNDFFSYTVKFDGNEINITASEDQVTVTNLTNTKKYNFTFFTVFQYARSSGVRTPAATAPPNAKQFNATAQNETSITLQWKKVGAILNYRLEFNDSRTITVNASQEGELVTEVVSGLTSGTQYTFTVFAVFENISSSGQDLRAATVPSQVASVTVAKRSVDSLTLEWQNVRRDWSYSLHINGKDVTPDTSKETVSEVISSLQPGTQYPFSVTTIFAGFNSVAFESSTVTTIDCAKATWVVTNSSIDARIEGLFTNATASNISHTHTSHGGGNVLFTGLYPGATYDVSLEYESNSELLNQCKHRLTINPPNLEAHCKYWDHGYSVYVGWNKPAGIWTEVEVKVTGKTHMSNNREQHIIIPGFQPAKSHAISVTSVSEGKKSTPYVFSCVTDPRGVIAGSFFGVVIFLALVCLVAFILLKKPEVIRRYKPFSGSTKKNNKPKAIPVEKFPEHFYQLGMDENRGFSQEYESLMPVGTEQTRRDAILPENKPKNRFNNVLPYDWCRVKLTSSDANGTLDYINANYMPGFRNSREYIATQGPLPSTVDDFWRMIWEQRVKGIVMVTNCRESGKTKCEQYWPEDTKSNMYGELSVFIRSEQKEPNWTLREFELKHKNYTEVRKVKHFHFTSWPDHGVPQGTQHLIQFRGLVRQHIDREGTGAPTVVHCSAGVGRTGTIIALDVLLQQLEKERAVGIKGFVHNMRLSRPHMVQTECIMDTLQEKEISEENIYENDESLYVNATALREFHKGSQV